MFDTTQTGGAGEDARNSAFAHPDVTVRSVRSRPRAGGRVIVFANEKGGVGKSTLAFHCAVALCTAGRHVAVIDLDRRQQSLSNALDNREGTARCLQLDLPRPNHAVLREQNGTQLSQEIARIGTHSDFVMIDVAGHDSPVARAAIAMADTLVTPLNSSFVDLDLLGKFDPVSRRLKEPGRFSRLVMDLAEARERFGMNPVDWIVVKNRMRSSERRQQANIDEALDKLAPHVGFRVARGLSERVIYRELYPFGLTHLDLKRIPGLAKLRARTEVELGNLLSDLGLTVNEQAAHPAEKPPKLRIVRETSEAYRASLYAHMNAA